MGYPFLGDFREKLTYLKKYLLAFGTKSVQANCRRLRRLPFALSVFLLHLILTNFFFENGPYPKIKKSFRAPPSRVSRSNAVCHGRSAVAQGCHKQGEGRGQGQGVHACPCVFFVCCSRRVLGTAVAALGVRTEAHMAPTAFDMIPGCVVQLPAMMWARCRS